MTIGSPLLAVANAIATATALHFHGGVQCNQGVKDHDLDRQREHTIVVPVNNTVIVALAIGVGIGGGGGGTMRLLVLKEESQEGRKHTRNWQWSTMSSRRLMPLR